MVVGLTMLLFAVAMTVTGMFVGNELLFEVGYPIAFVGAFGASVGTIFWARWKLAAQPRWGREQQ